MRPVTSINHQQGIIECVGVGAISCHLQGIAANAHRLVITAGDAELFKSLVEMDTVILGRAMADGINWYRKMVVLGETANHSCISMLVALQDQIDMVSINKVFKHPPLDGVVLALDRIKRMVNNQYFPH